MLGSGGGQRLPFLFTFSTFQMFTFLEKITGNVRFYVSRPSSALEGIEFYPLTGTAYCDWKSGSESQHQCKKRHMLLATVPFVSLGRFANTILLERKGCHLLPIMD